jgi:hypothetical protein
MKNRCGRVVVAHAYNSSYLGGRDQEDDLKPARANNPQDPLSKIFSTEKGLVEWLKWSRHEALSSNPSTTKKEEREKRKTKNQKTKNTQDVKSAFSWRFPC